MSSRKLGKAVLAGFLATWAMIFLGFVATRMGTPFLDWSRTLGAYFMGIPYLGYVLFFIAGVLMAIIYMAFFHDRLPGSSWQRGLFFAVLMWILTGAILAPVMQMGFFMGGAMVALGTLVTYIVYGLVLGMIYG